MSNPAKEILVIGLGLIGSSLAKAAKNKGLVVHGFDEDKNSLEEALNKNIIDNSFESCLLYTSPSPRDAHESRMPSSA